MAITSGTADSRNVGSKKATPMTKEEKKVIFASSLGTVFEWYDFYLYGSLAAIIAKQFFIGDPTTTFIFALLAFAAGFIVRPFGAIVFGRLGDMIGRKYTFLVTILIMGLSTFIVGLLPGHASIGIAAPIILVSLRILQGLALGGEYGGAATYVAEHAPEGKRGLFTSWIQTTATMGLFMSLLVILGTRLAVGEDEFAAWGWRIPFLVSVLLLGISVWIRMSMQESPAFAKMKAEGKTSKAPLSEAFGQWKNMKVVILALIGLTMGQAVVWYTGQFYALFFMQQTLKIELATANILIAIALLLATPFFIFFGALSDRIGRKKAIMLASLLALPVLPLWAFSSGPWAIGLGAFLMQFMVQGAWGVVPTYLTELVPANARAVLPGFVYQLGNLIASVNATLQSRIAEAHYGNYGLGMAIVAGTVAVLICLFVAFGRETRGIEISGAVSKPTH